MFCWQIDCFYFFSSIFKPIRFGVISDVMQLAAIQWEMSTANLFDVQLNFDPRLLQTQRPSCGKGHHAPILRQVEWCCDNGFGAWRLFGFDSLLPLAHYSTNGTCILEYILDVLSTSTIVVLQYLYFNSNVKWLYEGIIWCDEPCEITLAKASNAINTTRVTPTILSVNIVEIYPRRLWDWPAGFTFNHSLVVVQFNGIHLEMEQIASSNCML